ncbi:MAG: family 43 glycosylhydrolase [Chitinispirillaceae bacterium]|nr:family 43 glycosylhydrolase [Chitinispirillaceae bacterium]
MNAGNILRKSVNFLIGIAIVITTVFGDNPIISHRFTADPNPFIFEGRLYVICSSDEENVDSYNLINYTLVSTDDMVNWTDHGLVFKVKEVTKWAGQAYAPTACVRDGKVWLYFPNGATSIGVAVADRPEGPYTDALGKALITKNMTNCDVNWLFDPCIFLDSTANGINAYLTFGGGENSKHPYGKNLKIIKINDDMKSVSGTALTIEAPNSFEGPFIHKYNNAYYFSYPTSGASTLDYCMSDNPMSGWVHKGTFLDNPTLNGQNINQYNNSHGGPINYKGQWYMFYHDRRISDKVYKRNASVDLLHHNNDGTIQKVIVTSEGPAQIKHLNPYDTIQSETIWKQSGIETEFFDGRHVMLTDIQDGDYTSLKGVDFGGGAKSFEVRASSASNGGTIEIRIGTENGTLVGSCTIPGTGGWTTWKTYSCSLSNCSGLKNIYFIYKGSGEPFHLDWFRFSSLTTDAIIQKRSAMHQTGSQRRLSIAVQDRKAISNSNSSMLNLSGRTLQKKGMINSQRKSNGVYVQKR